MSFRCNNNRCHWNRFDITVGMIREAAFDKNKLLWSHYHTQDRTIRTPGTPDKEIAANIVGKGDLQFLCPGNKDGKQRHWNHRSESFLLWSCLRVEEKKEELEIIMDRTISPSERHEQWMRKAKKRFIPLIPRSTWLYKPEE